MVFTKEALTYKAPLCGGLIYDAGQFSISGTSKLATEDIPCQQDSKSSSIVIRN